MRARVDKLRHQALRARQEGWRETYQRLLKRALRGLDDGSLDFPLLPGDVADSATLPRLAPAVVRDRPLRVGWLTTPPGAGSGGHTTMFRMVKGLEDAGHSCRILVYDRHGGALDAQREVIRRHWPWIRAEVLPVDEGLGDVDACVATSWDTAHVLASRSAPVHPFYFIQDFEPVFYPRGYLHELALDSYRFGFTHLALGPMIEDSLRREVGADSHVVPFSCDTEVYRLTGSGPRNGVTFYAKPDVPRRGFLLGVTALEEFHRRHPEQEIHLYGVDVRGLPFPAIHHGRMTTQELNTLYNRCLVGLAISFTNVSLVAEEMLAAGCIPVVNDTPEPRFVLDSPHVTWARPTPTGFADALSRVVKHPDPRGRARAAAADVRQDNWTETARAVTSVIEKTVAEGR